MYEGLTGFYKLTRIVFYFFAKDCNASAHHIFFSCLMVLLTIFSTEMIWAGDNFTTSPTTLTLSPQKSIGTLTIKNNADYPLLLQSRIVTEDIYTQKIGTMITKDLIVTPPVILVPANTDQSLRVGIIKPIFSSKESKYRLYIKAIPQTKKKTIQRLSN